MSFLGYAGAIARPLRLEFPGALYHVSSRGNAPSPWENLRAQSLLGAAGFVEGLKPYLAHRRRHKEVPRAQRLVDRPALEKILPEAERRFKARRNAQIRKAHLQHGYTLTQIARHLDLHYTTVSKVINAPEN